MKTCLEGIETLTHKVEPTDCIVGMKTCLEGIETPPLKRLRLPRV